MRPQISESESRELRLDSYVTYIHHHQCANCGCVEMFSQIFEVWLHPVKTRITTFRDLRPLTGLSLQPLQMAQIPVPAKQVPICSHCIGAYKAQGQEAQIITSSQWEETLRRKYAPPPPVEVKVAKTSPATPKAVPRLDQI